MSPRVWLRRRPAVHGRRSSLRACVCSGARLPEVQYSWCLRLRTSTSAATAQTRRDYRPAKLGQSVVALRIVGPRLLKCSQPQASDVSDEAILRAAGNTVSTSLASTCPKEPSRAIAYAMNDAHSNQTDHGPYLSPEAVTSLPQRRPPQRHTAYLVWRKRRLILAFRRLSDAYLTPLTPSPLTSTARPCHSLPVHAHCGSTGTVDRDGVKPPPSPRQPRPGSCLDARVPTCRRAAWP